MSRIEKCKGCDSPLYDNESCPNLRCYGRLTPSLPEGYEVIDNALVHPDGSVIAISRSQKITTIQNPIITEMFKKKLDAIDSRALAIWLQRTTNQ